MKSLIEAATPVVVFVDLEASRSCNETVRNPQVPYGRWKTDRKARVAKRSHFLTR